MKLRSAILAVAVNIFLFCLIARAQTYGYINCEKVVLYKEAPFSSTERTIAGSLTEKTPVTILRESFEEFLVSGGETQGYVKKSCITIGSPFAPAPPVVAPPSQSPPVPSRALPTDRSAVDCSKVHSSQGCKSFNELLSTKDLDVFSAWKLGFRTWVCFTTSSSAYGRDEKGEMYSYGPFDGTEDKFYLITHQERRKGGLLFFEVYDKGIPSDSETGRFTTDEWRFVDARVGPKDSSLKFSGASTEDEIWFQRRFLNLNGTITTEEFALRTSTGRFTKKLQVKSPPLVSSESGYCFKNPDQITPAMPQAISNPFEEPRGQPLLDLEPLVQHGHVIEVQGRTEPAARVTVNGQQVSVVASDGSFHYFTPPLPNGENLITVTAQNARGGVSTQQKRVVIQ